jgi:hypothetical protein
MYSKWNDQQHDQHSCNFAGRGQSPELQCLRNNMALFKSSNTERENYNVKMMFVSQHGGCPSMQGGTLIQLLVDKKHKRQHRLTLRIFWSQALV